MDIDQWNTYVSRTLGVSPVDVAVERLTGGYVNSTVRLTLERQLSLPSHLSALSRTAILKHAPAYVHSDPTSPLSTFRQVAEARALRHLGTDPKLVAALEGRAVVPAVIWHDEAEMVLWMTDLGQRETLSSYLAAERLDNPGPDPTELGMQVGDLLARLHIAARNPSAELVAQFKDPNPSTGDVVAMLVDAAQRMMEQRGYADAKTLARRIGMGLGPDPEDGDRVWGMGDVWPGSVLLPAPTIALVDWEFAAAAHPGAEFGMLLAHLDYARLVPLHTPWPSPRRDVAKTRADALAPAFAAAYQSRFGSVSRSFRREALCAYGREMIVSAQEGSYGIPEMTSEGRDALVSNGAAVLRAVGENETEFSSAPAPKAQLPPFVRALFEGP